MRIWSIHPMYLDPVGLTACWRESLLARNVIAGRTKGYTKHPQLQRFLLSENPLDSIEGYLCTIFDESERRGYNYDKTKIKWRNVAPIISVTSSQIEYEFEHLKSKLISRNHLIYQELETIKNILPNPLFFEVEGEIENWEVIK